MRTAEPSHRGRRRRRARARAPGVLVRCAEALRQVGVLLVAPLLDAHLGDQQRGAALAHRLGEGLVGVALGAVRVLFVEAHDDGARAVHNLFAGGKGTGGGLLPRVCCGARDAAA